MWKWNLLYKAVRIIGDCRFYAGVEVHRYRLLLAERAPCNRILFLQKKDEISGEIRTFFWRVLRKRWCSSQFNLSVNTLEKDTLQNCSSWGEEEWPTSHSHNCFLFIEGLDFFLSEAGLVGTYCSQAICMKIGFIPQWQLHSWVLCMSSVFCVWQIFFFPPDIL